MNIRQATPDDIPAMAELLHQLFSIEKDFTPDFARQTKGLSMLLDLPKAQLFVADIDGEVVGMCSVQIRISTALGMDVGAVEDVIVSVDHRDCGIGSALMKAVEAWAAEKGLGRLLLRADRDNGQALCFYRKQGWMQTNLVEWMKPV